MKTANAVCEKCGAKIPDDTAGDLCPACLLETGLLDDEPAAGIVDLGGNGSLRAAEKKPAPEIGAGGAIEGLHASTRERRTRLPRSSCSCQRVYSAHLKPT